MPNRFRTSAEYHAARDKAATKHKIAQYIKDHYAMTGEPLCQGDLMKALDIKKNTANTAMRELVRDGTAKCVGTGLDSDRDDIATSVRLYGPPDAVMIGALPAVSRPAYVGKPESLTVARVKTPKYKGEKGVKYVPEFRELEPESYDIWRGRNLAMLAR